LLTLYNNLKKQRVENLELRIEKTIQLQEQKSKKFTLPFYNDNYFRHLNMDSLFSC
jgi:hypothetical protein